MAVAITATVQAVYPPRVLVSVTGLSVGNSVELFRVTGGERFALRAGTDVSVGDTSFLRVDAELPFGVPVAYLAIVGGVEYATGAVTYTLPGGKVALSDAVGGAAAEVVILSWPDRIHDGVATLFRVGGRNVVVSGDLGQYTSTAEVYVDTTSSSANLEALLRDATEGVVQVRQPGGYDGVDAYLAVTAAAERRFSQDGSDQRRVWALIVAEVEGWAPVLEALGFTLQDIADAYTGQTLQDIADDHASLLAIAQADFSP